jgi:hypothetical protein
MSTVTNVHRIDGRVGSLAAAILGLASLGSLLGPGTALSAPPPPVVNEKFSDLEPAIAELRQEAGKDRRAIVKANMLLTNSEAAQFWPLYDRYRAEREKLGDRRVRLITDFLAKRDSMSEEDAENLIDEAMSIDNDKNEVKEKYVAKMMKVLSARTVARFFQIDQKLDAVVDMELAARVPLIH